MRLLCPRCGGVGEDEHAGDTTRPRAQVRYCPRCNTVFDHQQPPAPPTADTPPAKP